MLTDLKLGWPDAAVLGETVVNFFSNAIRELLSAVQASRKITTSPFVMKNS